jgi:proteasome lid subunit RPN8/RPN11
MRVEIDSRVIGFIETELEKAYPLEACGFLLGTDDSSTRQITLALKAENRSLENHQRRFVISPVEYLRAEKYASENGLSLLGIYHSHPDHPAMPSVHDLEYAQPFFSYFISSIINGKTIETKSYRLMEDTLIEEIISQEPS